MTTGSPAIKAAVLVVIVAASVGGHGTSAQIVHTTGQNVQPVFEGWERNPDGTIDFVFGYLNRNYEEQPHIPIGPNNSFQPGAADRGQPTHFYPRRQQFVFRVTVPATWGKDEQLTWTLTHNGKTSMAKASLLPSWQLEEGIWRANRGGGIHGRASREVDVNARPVVAVVGASSLTTTVLKPLTLTVEASDDGRPGPRRKPARSRGEDSESISGLPALANRGGPVTQAVVKPVVAHATGLGVTWIHYRGPGVVAFEPMASEITPQGAGLKGKTSTSVTFIEPGTYVVRAMADDSVYTSPADVTVTVEAVRDGSTSRP